MKRNLVLLALAAEALIFFAATALLIHATLAAGNLRQDLADAMQRLATDRQAKLQVEDFEKTREELTRQEQEIRRRVPPAEREPLDLIKQLTILAREAGAEHLSLTLSPRVPENVRQAARPTTVPAFSPAQTDPAESNPRSSEGGWKATAAPAAPSLYAVPIQMDFEIAFPRVIDLLKTLRSFARVITLETASIDRSPGRAPRQQVTLTLHCYTFDSSPEAEAVHRR